MKILQVIDIFSPAAGGSAGVADRLSRELGRRGHEVTVFTTDFRLEQSHIDSLTGAKAYATHNYFSLGGKPLFMPGLLSSSKSKRAVMKSSLLGN